VKARAQTAATVNEGGLTIGHTHRPVVPLPDDYGRKPQKYASTQLRQASATGLDTRKKLSIPNQSAKKSYYMRTVEARGIGDAKHDAWLIRLVLEHQRGSES
jgi:hypothetical protein